MEKLINEYGNCFNLIYNCVLLFRKYTITRDTKTLLKISDNLKEVYNIEKVLVKEILTKAAKLYVDFLKRNTKELNEKECR